MSIYDEIRTDIIKSDIIFNFNLSIDRIVVGIFYAAVRLSDGTLGICCSCSKEVIEKEYVFSLSDEILDLAYLSKKPICEIMEFAGDPNLLKSVIGTALLNALSAILFRINSKEYNVVEEKDTLSLLKIKAEDTVAMVGAFPPFIRALKGNVRYLTVIDKDPDIHKCEDFPVSKGKSAYQAIPEADVVILTGVTFANGTIEELLKLTHARQRVAIVGPSIGPCPGPFLRRGVNVIGTVEIPFPEETLRVISHGGTHHSFKKYLKKIHIIGERTTELQ